MRISAFDSEAKVWFFGSRADDSKKGRDIDGFANDIFKPTLEYASIIEISVIALNSYCYKYLVSTMAIKEFFP